MSRHEVSPSIASPGAEEPIPLGYWPLSRPFPTLMTDADLRLVFGIHEATFYRWKKAGKFDRFKVSPPISLRHTYYSGARVRDYVLGEWTEARVFGAKRGTRPTQRIPVVALHGANSVGGAR